LRNSQALCRVTKSIARSSMPIWKDSLAFLRERLPGVTLGQRSLPVGSGQSKTAHQPEGYENFDRYKRAVMGVNRILERRPVQKASV